jgi:hypothetical protein
MLIINSTGCLDVYDSDSQECFTDYRDLTIAYRDLFDATRMVTIQAGRSKVRIKCYEAPLIRNSEWFRRRLAPEDDDSGQELANLLVRLPDGFPLSVPEVSAQYFRVYEH